MVELFSLVASAGGASLGGPADMWAAIVKDFSNITEPAAFAAFLQVLMIDLVLAGDNAIVIGLPAAGVAKDKRRLAIIIGILAATVLRLIFALLPTTLPKIVGRLLAGRTLLLWVCW